MAEVFQLGKPLNQLENTAGSSVYLLEKRTYWEELETCRRSPLGTTMNFDTLVHDEIPSYRSPVIEYLRMC